MQRSRAQEASITKRLAERQPQRQQTTERTIDHQHPIEPTVDHQHPTGRLADTPEQIDDIKRRAELMRHEGANEATIVKQIATETLGSEGAYNHPTLASQTREQEIDEILHKTRQRQLDEQRQNNGSTATETATSGTGSSEPLPTLTLASEIIPGMLSDDAHAQLSEVLSSWGMADADIEDTLRWATFSPGLVDMSSDDPEMPPGLGILVDESEDEDLARLFALRERLDDDQFLEQWEVSPERAARVVLDPTGPQAMFRYAMTIERPERIERRFLFFVRF